MRPALVVTRIAPDVTSPYSAERTPLRTSTDSILSVENFLKSMVLMNAVDEPVEIVASLETLEPLIKRPTPLALLSDGSLTARIVISFVLVRSGFAIIVPGISCMMSERLDA